MKMLLQFIDGEGVLRKYEFEPLHAQCSVIVPATDERPAVEVWVTDERVQALTVSRPEGSPDPIVNVLGELHYRDLILRG